ncbi:hypothetical protein GS682_29485 [Nostoc sp. B(2019)]|nr:hypothetical protein [Nostoc sp. B(2019)]
MMCVILLLGRTLQGDRLPKIPPPTLISKGGAARYDEAQPQLEISSKKKGGRFWQVGKS